MIPALSFRAAIAASMVLFGSVSAVYAQTTADSFDPGANDTVMALAIQSDGKILVGGFFTRIGGGGFGSTSRSRIARLNSDGSVDATFNPGANSNVAAIVVQPDGKILVGGNFTTIGGGSAGFTTRNRIARLNSDGTVDTSFNPGANNAVTAIAVQADGKIVLGGAFTTLGGGGTGTTARNYIGRLHADGSLDTSFNPGADSDVFALAIQSDGAIVVAGYFFKLGGGGTGTTSRSGIGRLTSSGSVDMSFDPSANSGVLALLVQPDGAIVVGGQFTRFGSLSTGVTRRSLARLSSTGTVESAFDPGTNGEILSMALQPDGKIVVAGGFSTIGGGGSGSTTRHDIARLNANGSLDATFDAGTNATVYEVALQPDGKTIVGGTFGRLGGGGSGTTTRNYIGRLNTGSTTVSSPTISTVSPASGPATGGTSVTITGTGFVSGATVSVGGVAATSVSVASSTTITAVTGAHAAGTVDVVVTNADGGTTTKSGAFTYTAAAASVSLDKQSLVFTITTSASGAVVASTPAQSVRVTPTGASSLAWAAQSSQSWLLVTPATGAAPGSFLVLVNADARPSGSTATGTVTVSVAGSTAATVTVTLNTLTDASSPPPIGTVDTPAEGSVLAGSVAVTGWSLDNVGVKRVEIWRDPLPGEPTPTFASSPTDPRNGKIFISNATFVDGARPDVEGLYASMPFAYRGGWGYLLLTWGLYNSGNGTYKLYAFSFDQEDKVTTLGVKTVTFNNDAATKPFGSIDTPAIGGEAGTTPNFGWALTPKVNGVATCKIPSNGVQVSIDSGPLQPVVYGDARSDIAGAFPGFSNSAAAGGHFTFDWSTLTNGPHTIGWLVTDDCNRADGVGSRYFSVTNGVSSVIASASGAPSVDSNSALVASGFSRNSLAESDDPITVARGYGELPEIVAPGLAGARIVELKQGQRIELRTPRGYETAFQIVGGQARALPLGSSWDASSGTFYWQPAPGFLGRYRLVFSNGRQRVSVRIVVVP